VRHFTVAPPLKVRGRTSKGLRGLAGKPFHPPLTDVPIAAYLFAAVFDVLSLALHDGHAALGRELFHAGTWVLLGGAAASVLAAVTGWADWHRSSTPGTQVRRTVNTHAVLMLTVTALVLADLAVRLAQNGEASTPTVSVVLSVVAALLVSVGASYGGSLVYDYGFNVETAGDHPVWHLSETDV
jgi:uncharacterized membrane protein